MCVFGHYGDVTEYNFLEYVHEISTMESVVLEISIMRYRSLFP